MSADSEITLAADRITVDDVKRRAVAVRDLAVSEAKETARVIAHDQLTRTIVVGVVAVVAVTSLAYYLGTRRYRRPR